MSTTSTTSTWNRKQVVTTIVVAVLIALVVAQAYSLAILLPARAGLNTTPVVTPTGNGTIQNTITVIGTGHASLKPDTGLVSVGVLTQGSTVQSAVQDNTNTMNQILQALTSIGIDESSIKTTSYYVSPIYAYPTGQQPTITGYQVTNQIQVTVVISSGHSTSELGTRVGQVIDTAVSKGANQLNGVQFTASQSVFQKAQQSALQDAGKDASQQASTLASALGVRITGLVSASVGNNYNPPVYYSRLDFAAQAASVVAPSSLDVTVTVQAVFAIS